MELDTAIKLFRQIEGPRYDWSGSMSPHFNVRLDATTSRDDRQRGFRIFVRIDEDTPEDLATDNLRFLIDLAEARGVTPSIENGGVEMK